MINIRISLFPEEDCKTIAVPLHELVHNSLLRVVARVVLEPRALLEIILNWVCTLFKFEEVRFDLSDEEALSHSFDLVVHEVMGKLVAYEQC